MEVKQKVKGDVAKQMWGPPQVKVSAQVKVKVKAKKVKVKLGQH